MLFFNKINIFIIITLNNSKMKMIIKLKAKNKKMFASLHFRLIGNFLQN